jgi:hypothetical protein
MEVIHETVADGDGKGREASATVDTRGEKT